MGSDSNYAEQLIGSNSTKELCGEPINGAPALKSSPAFGKPATSSLSASPASKPANTHRPGARLTPSQTQDALYMRRTLRLNTQEIEARLNYCKRRDDRGRVTEAQVYNTLSLLRAVDTTPTSRAEPARTSRSADSPTAERAGPLSREAT